MRVLIVGGGVAGLSLAARLARQGRDPVVVDRAPADDTPPDLALTLSPSAAATLHGIGAHEALAARACVADRLELRNGIGRTIADVDLKSAFRAGPPLVVRRTGLAAVLAAAADGVDRRPGTTVRSLDERPEVVTVELSDGTTHDVDLVVAAEGWDAGVPGGTAPRAGAGGRWVLWTWWADGGLFAPTAVVRQLGLGWTAGVSPVPGGAMCLLALPAHRAPDADDLEGTVTVLRAALARLVTGEAAEGRTLGAPDGAARWLVADHRAAHWATGRVVRCGDAAASFLATSGWGASAALVGAATLAEELSRADGHDVRDAAARYERRCRPGVLAAQRTARLVARATLLCGITPAHLRNRALERVPGPVLARGLVGPVPGP